MSRSPRLSAPFSAVGPSRDVYVAVAPVPLLFDVGFTPREHRWRHAAADIATLAAFTRVDHYTIFLEGHTRSGYFRNGLFHPVFSSNGAMCPAYEPRGRRKKRFLSSGCQL